MGCGQWELIIGNRQAGKTTVATDTIFNQMGQNVMCVYVAIGHGFGTGLGFIVPS